MLDTGAACSILGNNSHLLLKERGCKVIKHHSLQNIITADGSNIKCKGYMLLPVCYNNKCRIIKFNIVPNIQTPIILGIDFIKYFRINFNKLYNNNKMNKNQIIGVNSLQLNNGLIDLDSLNSNQRRIVENIKTKFNSINTQVVGLGRTHLAKHTIDTGEHQPIKMSWIKC